MATKRRTGANEFLPVDFDKVKKAIKNHGFSSISEFCRQTGHAVTWVCRIRRNGGKINKPMLVWLNHFGIEYDEIKPDPVEEKQAEIPLVVRQLTKEDLKEMIIAAMKAALYA